ncbi:MAG: FG-GAP-like repeat-containing protein, partial [Bacteroidota bacterium]
TTEAGIVNNRLGFGLGLGISDLNDDGWPDVYVSNDYSGKDHLYVNQQDGTFQEQIEEATQQISFNAMGNDIGDINNDGWPDIVNLDMVAADNYGIKTSMSAMNPVQFHALVEQGEHHQYMFNSLLLNQGPTPREGSPRFSNIGQLAGISNTDWSWAPLLLDLDNDGWQDLLITNGIKRNIRNNDAVRVVQGLNERLTVNTPREEQRLLFQRMLQQFPRHEKPNYFFRNRGDLRFTDITADLGLDSLYSVSSGAAYADLDRDGDLDLVINNAGQPAFLLKNNADQLGSHRSLLLRFAGPPKNRHGIGTKVRLRTSEGQQYREVYTSRGYLSSVEPLVHFGLGAEAQPLGLTVTWPDGKQQVIDQLAPGQHLLDYQDARFPTSPPARRTPRFTSAPRAVPLVAHRENPFDDFGRERLLPHRMSTGGPAAAVGDVNQDGYPDVFVGGAAGQAAQLLLGANGGSFRPYAQELWEAEKRFEDVAATFFDADGDGDLDLVVGSGSNEWPSGDPAYRLRFYENKGTRGLVRNERALPDLRLSAGVITAGDFDGDGDADLFVGNRQRPGNYPQSGPSYLLRNESSPGTIRLRDATAELAPFLQDYGMVTTALWADLNGDGWLDLATAGEWMSPRILLHEGDRLVDRTEPSRLGEERGWWYALAAADFDGDGDLDLVGGNLGL